MLAIISEEKRAFYGDRYIHDNIVIAQEALYFLKKKQKRKLGSQNRYNQGL